MTGITPEELAGMIQDKIPLLILDTRNEGEFVRGHIAGAANAGFGTMQQKQVVIAKTPRTFKVVLIDHDGSEAQQSAGLMARFGFDAHFLEGGMAGWTGSTVKSGQRSVLSGEDLWRSISEKEDLFLLDVREPHEFADFRIPGAVNVPLSQLFAPGSRQSVPEGRKVITICSHGNRSMVATFALAQMGIEASSLEGGMARWNQVLSPTATIRDAGLTLIQVEKVGKGCLSYILGSGGKAVVIDPAHPASRYTEIAAEEGLAIVAVADTHQHADHVSAAAQLAQMTGSRLYLSADEDYRIDAVRISGGGSIPFGEERLLTVHTPGHTAGSMTYLAGSYAFCGDILSVDGVGRPDLRDRADEFAERLYNTLHTEMLKLPPDTKIFPAHRGAGTELADDDTYHTTPEMASRMTLMGLERADFVKRVAGTAEPRPANYSMIIRINRGSIPVSSGQIPDLEMGPNRCSVRA